MADSIVKQVKLINRMGLHARAAAKFAQQAGTFSSDVIIRKNDTEINAKSIMGILMLAIPVGDPFEIEACGADAQDAIDSLSELIDNRFGEDS